VNRDRVRTILWSVITSSAWLQGHPPCLNEALNAAPTDLISDDQRRKQ